MSTRLANTRFWLKTLAAVVVAGVTFALGQWQLSRAAQKEQLQLAVTAQELRSPLDNQSLFAMNTAVLEVLHRPAVLKGRWLTGHTVFLDNRQMKERVGFIVLTPLLLDRGSQVEGSQAILVQRGWVPRHFDSRATLPDIPTPQGLVTVAGRIEGPPGRIYQFGGAETGVIRQNVTLPAFAKEIAKPLLPVTLLQTGPASEGLQREWTPADTGLAKHYGYAFQWFAMSALVVFLYLWFQIIQPFRLKKRSSSNLRDVHKI